MKDLETRAFIANAERVAERVKAMSLDELITMWNDNIADHYCRTLEIYPIKDTERWEWMADELGVADMVERLFESELNEWFFPDHTYFFYDSDEDLFHSFSTKEDLLDSFITCFIDYLLDSEED